MLFSSEEGKSPPAPNLLKFKTSFHEGSLLKIQIWAPFPDFLNLNPTTEFKSQYYLKCPCVILGINQV